MMRSKSFEAQGLRKIGLKEAGESRGFPILWMEIIEDVKKKIHPRARKVLLHGIGNFVWASGNGGGKVRSSRQNFSGRERRAKERVRFLRARGSPELREVASGSATQGLWLRNGKVGSQVSGIDRSRFPGRRTIGEVRRGGRRASDRKTKPSAKKNVVYL